VQKREKILLAAVLVLVGVMGLNYVYGRLQQQFDERQQQISALRRDISRKKLQVLKGTRASKRLSQFQDRSLPAEAEFARSLYQNWLIGLVEEAGISGGVTSQSPQTQRGAFDRLSFTVAGAGSLEQVVRLLHEFYTANHLQQVRMLSLKPLDEGKRFDMILAIEALAVPGAAHADRLPSPGPPRLRMTQLAAYQKPIAERNIFAPFKPPAPPKVVEAPPPPPPSFDAARHTTVSAIISKDGRPQVWLNNRTSGKVLRLDEGSQFEVGALRGTIQRIGLRDVEVLAGGKRWLLTLGEHLREGTLLPDGDL
jgi:hypothetical protein